MPFNGLDIVIAAIIIFSIISGMRHGLVIVLGEFVALLTALLLAIIFTGDVSQLLEDTLAVRTALEQFLYITYRSLIPPCRWEAVGQL